MSEDLIDWLRAQIDLDQQKAAAFSAGTWVRRGQRDVYSLDGDAVAAGADRAEADFIADHDPARVLLEVDSLRKIIDLHEPREYVTYLKHVTYWQCGYCAGLCHSRSGLGCEQPVDALWPCDTVRLLAAIFSGRPGFREEWRA